MSTLGGRRGMRPKMMMPFDAQPPQPVISAHPIHSLDSLQPQHYHSLASPTRTYLYHPQASGGRYHPCASPIAHLSRGESIGEAFHLTHCGSCSALTRCGECVT
ncbi:unnamed protein product [Knipowitschia caucasica]